MTNSKTLESHEKSLQSSENPRTFLDPEVLSSDSGGGALVTKTYEQQQCMSDVWRMAGRGSPVNNDPCIMEDYVNGKPKGMEWSGGSEWRQVSLSRPMAARRNRGTKKSTA